MGYRIERAWTRSSVVLGLYTIARHLVDSFIGIHKLRHPDAAEWTW
jgi:hypothetical protein